MTVEIVIPDELLPKDGRFGSGPSKIRQEQIDYVLEKQSLLGTSHRQKPIKTLVGDIQNKLKTLFELPQDFEVILTNGGASLMWDALSYSAIKQKSAHGVYGEFSSRFCNITKKVPHLDDPIVVNAEPGNAAYLETYNDVDTYCLTHNETSTGVMIDLYKVGNSDSIVVVDATSGAGSTPIDNSTFDMYYFSLQKAFGSEGGLVFGLCSPKMVERIESIDRYAPAVLDLKTTVENSRLNQTLNTPSLVTLMLLDSQLDWLLDNGGISFAHKRCLDSSSFLFDWANKHELLSPFVKNKNERSLVTATIDVDPSIDAEDIVSVLRKNNIVDCDPYRKLGKNQIRVATFPAIELEDISLLTKSIDYVLERLKN